MKVIDINVDLGEGFAFDRELLMIATSANVCCGAHAGSFQITEATVQLCDEMGVRMGAHPGYPDRANMGRRPMGATPSDEGKAMLDELHEQVETLAALGPVAYVKPHGALYNESAAGGAWSQIVLQLVCRLHLPLMGMPGSRHEWAAKEAGVPFIAEGFADRAYLPDGRLKPRGEPGAVLTEPAEVAAGVLRVAPNVRTICVHGDTPCCVDVARLVRRTLEEAGYEVKA